MIYNLTLFQCTDQFFVNKSKDILPQNFIFVEFRELMKSEKNGNKMQKRKTQVHFSSEPSKNDAGYFETQ